MCKVISCISFKGGVGKSTTVVNLSSYISMQGRKVCVIDLDAQHNLSRHFGIEVNSDTDTTVYDLLNASIDECSDEEMKNTIKKSIHKTTTVDLIPSSAKLSALETVIPSVTCRERILEYVISFLKPDYDFIFMDCHPGLDMFSLNALTASNSVIVPVEAHIMSSDGLPDVFQMIRTVRKKLNPKLKIEGILITKFQGRTNYCRTVNELIQREFGGEIHIYEDSIKYAIKVAEAPGYGVSIHEYAPEIDAAKSYANIAREVMLNV